MAFLAIDQPNHHEEHLQFRPGHAELLIQELPTYLAVQQRSGVTLSNCPNSAVELQHQDDPG